MIEATYATHQACGQPTYESEKDTYWQIALAPTDAGDV